MGDLLILLQVRKRLVEELIGDVDRLGIDDFFIPIGSAFGTPSGVAVASTMFFI